MFYDFTIEVMKLEEIKNELGQRVKTPILDYSISCDVQPSTQKLIRDTFGDSIESVFTVYADEDFDIGTILKYLGRYYEINGKLDWVDYKIYSLKGSDRF